MSLTEKLKNRVLTAILLASGPFYFYPPKGLLNKLLGTDYGTAYYHFRQDHKNTVNLALHFVCFFVQIFGNFGLLNELDSRGRVPQPFAAHGVRTLSAASALLWSVVQLSSPAPKLHALVASAAIASAYFVAPHMTTAAMDHFSFGTFLLMLVASNMATGIVHAKDMVKAFVIVPCMAAAFQYAEENFYKHPAAQPYKDALLLGSFAWIALVPLVLSQPLKPLVITAVPLLRAAYIATGDKALFWLGYAFIASLLQGITHNVAREAATLLNLEKTKDWERTQFEYAHVTFFPSLAINSLFDWWNGVPPPKKPAGYDEKTK